MTNNLEQLQFLLNNNTRISALSWWNKTFFVVIPERFFFNCFLKFARPKNQTPCSEQVHISQSAVWIEVLIVAYSDDWNNFKDSFDIWTRTKFWSCRYFCYPEFIVQNVTNLSMQNCSLNCQNNVVDLLDDFLCSSNFWSSRTWFVRTTLKFRHPKTYRRKWRIRVSKNNGLNLSWGFPFQMEEFENRFNLNFVYTGNGLPLKDFPNCSSRQTTLTQQILTRLSKIL